MGQHRQTRPLVSALMTALTTALTAALMGAAQAADPPRSTSAEDRIRQVENGLLPAVTTPRTVPRKLAERMRELQVPGLSVAVVDHGQLAWAHAWGLAREGQPMTTATLLQAASISKPVSAVAALQAVEQGRLGLDSELGGSLRSWQLPAGAQSADKPVTLRRLLSHSAGFTVGGFDGYAVDAPLPTLLQVLDGQPPANSAAVRVDLPPGTEWRYSGGGYAVLQLLLQDLSGQPFATLMQQAVLAPAGMRSSFFAPPGPLTAAQLPTVACGHQQGRPLPGCYRIHPELAAAGLWTTPSELARFNLALPQLLGPAMRAEALKPQFDQSGLGFVVDAGQGRYGHDGSNAGFESRWLASNEDGGRAVVVMANANGTRSLMNEVIRAIAAAQGWTSWMPPTHASIVAKIRATPLFVRGSLNDWGTSLALKPVGRRRYAATTEAALPAGRIEFKLASEDWRTVDLGAAAPASSASDSTLALGKPAALGVAGANLVLDVPEPGRYRFELDTSDGSEARLRVSRVTSAGARR